MEDRSTTDKTENEGDGRMEVHKTNAHGNVYMYNVFACWQSYVPIEHIDNYEMSCAFHNFSSSQKLGSVAKTMSNMSMVK